MSKSELFMDPTRYAVVVVKKNNGKPLALIMADASAFCAHRVAKHFTKGMKKLRRNRKAVAVPVA